MAKKKTPVSCDWKARPAEGSKKKAGDKGKLFKHKGSFTWQGVKTERYKAPGEDWSDIKRMVLVGDHNASARFHLRYFEIMPGGFSSLETHRHEHVVVCVRGKGRVRMGRKTHEVGFMDTIYIPPDAVHQLRNPFDEPFGFLCIVNAKRDRPRLIV